MEDTHDYGSVRGAPPMYATPEELQEAADGYFRGGMRMRKVMVGFGKNRHVEELPMPTISDLVLYLGFADRSSFYDYEKKADFSYTIKRIRTFIEREYEEMLQTSSNPSGAIFALKNFGWKDVHEVIDPALADTREKLKELFDNGDGLQNDGEQPDSPADDATSADPESI